MRKFLVKVNGTDYEVEVEEITAAGAAKENTDTDMKNSENAGNRSTANITTAGPGAVNAPLPGTIAEIMVVPGQKVSQGETVLLLEAMKMQNEIASPLSGVVQEIFVGKGDNVILGQTMVSIG